jgi:hypothetical protein
LGSPSASRCPVTGTPKTDTEIIYRAASAVTLRNGRQFFALATWPDIAMVKRPIALDGVATMHPVHGCGQRAALIATLFGGAGFEPA